VACSRATSKEGLYIQGKFEPPKAPSEDDKETIEMARLRQNPFSPSLEFLQDHNESFLKVYFDNVQSFLPHLQDMLADKCATMSNLIVLVEPHLLETDVIEIPNFEVFFKKCCHRNRNSEGLLILKSIVTEGLSFKKCT